MSQPREAGSRPLRIVLVEDEATNRVLLRAMLARSPRPEIRAALLVEAANVAEGRTALTGELPDLVLLDVRLPDGSGLDLARELADRAEARPPVVIMSASVLPEERELALAAGDLFVPKPYRANELFAAIDALLPPAPSA